MRLRALSAAAPVFLLSAAPLHAAEHLISPLSVTVLGSGGPGATGRAGSSYLISLEAVPRVLVDAGPGSFVRLGESHLSLQATDIVLITHLHADHVAELPGLAKARAVSSNGPLQFRIWGPAGAEAARGQAFFPSTSHLIELLFGARGAYAYLQDFAAPIRWHAHDLSFAAGDVAARTILEASGLKIRAAHGHHGDAPAVIYRIDYAGKSIVVSGDIDAAGLPALRSLAKNADLLIFDCPVLDPPDSPAELYELHSPPKAIGEVAAGAGVHQLLLSHLSPATEGEQAGVEASVHSNYSGKIIFARDALQIGL